MEIMDHRLTRRLSLESEQTERLFSLLAKIDATKTVFSVTDKLAPQTIERLTQSVIITSTGASNRIEGNQLTDAEVEKLYQSLRIKKFKTRDEQEVAGYIEMLSLIFESYEAMPLSESLILQLHRDMLAHSNKDERQRGAYKFGSNRVEALDQSGRVVGVVFDPTPPHLTPIEMRDLLNWYSAAREAKTKHPLLLLANFIFEFLAIHPFQDGNGRSSRLLTNLLLLQEGFSFASIVSHEQMIEARKADYYRALNKSQKSWKTSEEDVYPWLEYFVNIVDQQATAAMALLEQDHTETLLSDNQQLVWQWFKASPGEGKSRKDIIEHTGYPTRTVEYIVKKLLDHGLIERIGLGRGTRYRVKPRH